MTTLASDGCRMRRTTRPRPMPSRPATRRRCGASTPMKTPPTMTAAAMAGKATATREADRGEVVVDRRRRRRVVGGARRGRPRRARASSARCSACRRLELLESRRRGIAHRSPAPAPTPLNRAVARSWPGCTPTTWQPREAAMPMRRRRPPRPTGGRRPAPTRRCCSSSLSCAASAGRGAGVMRMLWASRRRATSSRMITSDSGSRSSSTRAQAVEQLELAGGAAQRAGERAAVGLDLDLVALAQVAHAERRRGPHAGLEATPRGLRRRGCASRGRCRG